MTLTQIVTAAILLLVVSAAGSDAAPSVVKVVKNGDGYQLLRNGTPYFVKGAGGSGSKEILKDSGGNSFRTWGVEGADVQLAEADRLGLTGTIGIWLGHKEYFNYSDPKRVAGQLETARKDVEKLRDAAALLIWGIGNEMELPGKGDDAPVWNAVEDIARMVKQEDPNHPTMTVVAEVNPDKIAAINRYCPDIDIIGINSYAGCATLADRYKAAGGVKPYIVTEFGPPGVWEWAKTSWKAGVEPTSTEKAVWYRKSYVGAVADQPMCLGSYAFLWGNKQETTPTWFGMLLPDGSKLGAVDAMSELWTGQLPASLAPRIHTMQIDGPTQVAPNSTVHATLDVLDPQNDPLKVEWILEADAMVKPSGGGPEDAWAPLPDAILRSDNASADVRLPEAPGPYRLFAYVHNAHNEAAVANIPLLVAKAH